MNIVTAATLMFECKYWVYELRQLIKDGKDFDSWIYNDDVR